MLHTMFQDQRTSGFCKRFIKVFTIYGHGGHLRHVTWPIYINFGSPFPRMFKGGRISDGCQLNGYTISSPCEPKGKQNVFLLTL